MSHNSITGKHPQPTCTSNLITSTNTSDTVTHYAVYARFGIFQNKVSTYSADLLILINVSEHCTSLDR